MGKAAYFDALYTLDDDSDEDNIPIPIPIPVPGVSFSIPSSSAASPTEDHEHLRPRPKTTPSLGRSLSAPASNPRSIHIVKGTPLMSFKNQLRQERTGTPLSNEVSFVEETPSHPGPSRHHRLLPQKAAPAQTPSLNHSLSLQTPTTSTLGKRKRKEPSIKLVPEEHRIFKDLVFFYIPPDDIAPVRRARIIRAREHGATWTTEFTESVTHIIADRHLSYKDITSFLKIPSIPSHITLVNESYPLDCIQFKTIVNSAQKQYFVKGLEQGTPKDALVEVPPQKAASQTSDRSLQLKEPKSNPGRWGHVPPRDTPPRSENSGERPSATGAAGQTADLAEAPMFGTMSDGDYNTELFNTPNEVELPRDANTRVRPDDHLDEMIKETRTVQHLPLDEDDEDLHPSSPAQHGSGSSDSDGSPSPKRKFLPQNPKSSHENFSCMKGGSVMAKSSNPNSRTISILQEMADYYARMGDTWRPIAYRKAITTLKRQTKLISTAEEAARLPAIGQRLAQKIEEIVLTDHLKRLDNAKSEPSDKILQLFLGIYGIGISQASTWLQQGYCTLDDLLAHANLTENQRLGIIHYADFQTRIPRAEVSALGQIVKDTASSIDPTVEVIIGGSYRRGAESCGDIDVLLTKPGTSACSDLSPFLHELVSQLRSSGLLVAALAVGRSESSSKWHGCCVLPGQDPPIWRRIDFHLAPASELGAALIYFTGNEIFNRSIRLLASRRGMRLNQRGLFKNVMRGLGRVKLNEGELVEGADEKKIFAALGVPWRPPEERVC